MNDALRSSVLDVAGLTIAREFYDLICDEALLGTGIENAICWTNFSSIIHDLTPKNRGFLSGATNSRRSSTPGIASMERRSTSQVTKPSCVRSATTYRRDRNFRSRLPMSTPRSRRSPGRSLSSGDEYPLRPERRQCPLGFALRRALRQRCNSPH